MKKLAKLLALGMALALCLGLFSACGQQEVELKIMEGGSLAPEEYGIGFRKEDVELRDTVNAALQVLAAEGTLAEISTEWFGSDITTIEADASALDNINPEAREFILGLDDSFPPMGYRNEQNEIVGFDIDVANAVCEKLGWTLVVQPIECGKY